MNTPTVTPPAPAARPTVRDEERADELETADDARAPVHSERERKVLVRDAYGNDPYGGSNDVTLGQEPYELPDPRERAVREAKARTEETADAISLENTGHDRPPGKP